MLPLVPFSACPHTGKLVLPMTVTFRILWHQLIRRNTLSRASFMAQWLTNPISIHEDLGLIPGLAQWIRDPVLPWAVMYFADSSDLALLWLWCRSTAVALIRPLAWECLYASAVALKSQKKKKKKKKTNNFPSPPRAHKHVSIESESKFYSTYLFGCFFLLYSIFKSFIRT